MKRLCAVTGRILVALGGIALIGAWITQITERNLLGMSQEHLFNDAITLTLLGIAMLIDSLLHHKKT